MSMYSNRNKTYCSKEWFGGVSSNYITLNILTNSMAYESRRLNAAFTRALQ